MFPRPLCILILALATAMSSAAAERQRDVVYLHAEGVAMAMDVFVPENPNGLGIISVVSGGWKSRHERVKDDFGKLYTDEGYTVFAVFHGSQPRFQVRDIMGYLHRAVRFIRFNADRWSVDPERLGVTGASAGGHLSLILATQGGPGDPAAEDPIDRVSSAVAAAAVFYPPTDYLNWRHAGDDAVGVGPQKRWQPAFGPEAATAEGRQTLGRAMSSIYHLSPTSAPALIIHGDADPIVPLYQAESYQRAAEAVGVEVDLVIKEGAKHGWPDRAKDEVAFLHYFNERLRDAPDTASFEVGTCDWTLRLAGNEAAFEFAERVGLQGIQFTFGPGGEGIDLRRSEDRQKFREIIQRTGVPCASLGIGALNRIPLSSTNEGEQLVADCLEAMAALKAEAAALDDRKLAAMVAPDIVLLAFFSKGDINGEPELMENVITKLKRLAPVAEKHGITMAIESLLSEQDHRYILDQVESSALKVYYDTANSARMGYDIYTEIESLGVENIVQIHLKEDNAFLGDGPIDFLRIKRLLTRIDYDGWLILEGATPKGTPRIEAGEVNAAYALELFGS